MSITIHPFLAAFGAYSAEILPPGENKPMWAFEKSNSDKSSTTISLSLNSTFLPFDFDDASKYKLSIGKCRWIRRVSQ